MTDPRASDSAGSIVEPRAVGRGLLVALAIVVPAGLAQYAVRDTGWVWLLLGMILAGFAVAGHAAATVSVRGPLTNGGLAAFGAFAVSQGANIAVRSAAGDPVAWAGLPLVAMLSTSCGVLGAWVWLRRGSPGALRPPDRSEGDLT